MKPPPDREPDDDNEPMEERLLHAEMAVAAAEAQAAEQARRRRKTTRLAIGALLFLLGAVVAFYFAEEARVSRRIRSADRAHAAFARAELMAERAETTQDLPLWLEAYEEARRAAGFAGDADRVIAMRAEHLLATLRTRAEQVTLAARLEKEAEGLTAAGRIQEALEVWRRVEDAMPEYAHAYVRRGDLLLAGGDAGEAADAYRNAWMLRPDGDVLERLVQALGASGNRAGVTAAAEEGVKALPNAPEAWTILGTVRRGEGDAAGMLEAWRTARRVDPTYRPAHARLEAFYTAAARAGDARVVDGDLLPSEGVYLAAMAQASLRAAKPRQALALYERAFAADPTLETPPTGARPHRTNAAVAAVRASVAAADEADGEIDEGTRHALRKMALAWLQADLAHARDFLEASPVDAAPELLQALAQWKALGALAPIRPPFPATFPAQEQAAFERLWTDVDELVERATVAVAEAWSEETARRFRSVGVLLGLGEDLFRRGRLQASLEAWRRADQLGRKLRDPPVDTGRLVREAEARVDREARIPAVLDESVETPDAEELADMARIRLVQDRHADALKLYEMLFAEHPAFRSDRPLAVHRYNAACAALRVSETAEEPDASTLREKALRWLQRTLTRYGDAAEPSTEAERRARRAELAWWRDDPDLASVRGDEAVAALADEGERQSWVRFWRDVDRLLE